MSSVSRVVVVVVFKVSRAAAVVFKVNTPSSSSRSPLFLEIRFMVRKVNADIVLGSFPDLNVIGLDLSEESISGGIENSTGLYSLQHLQSLNLALGRFHLRFQACRYLIF
ncbi:hypothetical protein EZV62_016682 [Acer yangbiense]|uniref:Uncharacterized protein n=1 Tax=Acer yangbiense TaxID=1000413 RepID=A0A5C7HP61_9ROSI|nr:hypothetical protein EZV62_016682 [Acer yangbiense]